MRSPVPTIIRPARSTTILAAVVAALALAPAAASASSLSYEGDVLVLRASPGEANSTTLSSEEAGRLSVTDETITAFPGDRCTQLDPQYAVHCDAPRAVRVELGDGDDRLVVSHTAPAGLEVLGRGGPGRDELKAIAGQTRSTFEGGDGDDRLRSEEGADVLRGGADADELLGGPGADVLEGGDGGDRLTGDACGAAAPDVLDGGAGYDTLTDWGDCGPGSDRRRVTVTVNGAADDGRPGEGDDVRDLDVLELFVPATVTGGDGPESVQVFAPADGPGSTIDGRGGDDDLRTGATGDALAGGAGNDRVEGGFGHDTLSGGPGRDQLFGDSTAAQCGGSGQSCTVPFGNDAIDARDGEVDHVDCGPGQDRAVVDAVDVVAENCEAVDRAGATPQDGTAPKPGTTDPVRGQAARRSLSVRAPGRLGVTLRRGLTLKLAGFPRGKLTVRARAGRLVVGTTRVRVTARGTATATLRFTRTARRKLARRGTVRLTVVAGSVSRSVTLRR